MSTLHLPVKKLTSVRRLGILYDAWLCTQAQQHLGQVRENLRTTVPVLWRKKPELIRC